MGLRGTERAGYQKKFIRLSTSRGKHTPYPRFPTVLSTGLPGYSSPESVDKAKGNQTEVFGEAFFKKLQRTVAFLKKGDTQKLLLFLKTIL